MNAHDTVPARFGKAFPLEAGQTLRLINTTGRQVVDTWAFCDPDISEVLSMEHSRGLAAAETLPATSGGVKPTLPGLRVWVGETFG